MYCTKCGEQNPDDSGFCSACGNGLIQDHLGVQRSNDTSQVITKGDLKRWAKKAGQYGLIWLTVLLIILTLSDVFEVSWYKKNDASFPPDGHISVTLSKLSWNLGLNYLPSPIRGIINWGGGTHMAPRTDIRNNYMGQAIYERMFTGHNLKVSIQQLIWHIVLSVGSAAAYFAIFMKSWLKKGKLMG